ncbi:MAG: transporter, DctM subunit [Clostridia bacterium]|jgi:tripartite ATP-independent transporter DctM subunit|nr:transporter, DctM subunit [Clostridia bacterium]
MTIILIAFAILLILGIPIAVSIAVSAVIGLIVLDYPIMIIGQKMITGIDSFLLISIPLFILAGELMNVGKITEKIFDFAQSLVGWIPGGLAHANVVASIIFAGMSGSAIADAGGLGTIEMKAMTDNGYDEEFSGAITAASSTIGPIFPPSIPLIIYGSVASVSVGKLFLGGIIPGLLMGIALMVLVSMYAVKRNYPRTKFHLKQMLKQFAQSLIPLFTPVIILSGFLTGWFTPTEASSIAVLYALLVGKFIYRAITWEAFKKALFNSALTSANVLFIIGTSTLFSYILTNQGISNQIASFILGITDNPYIILLVINIILLLLGMIMEPGAILTLLLPVLLPVIQLLGIDLVHFGIVMVLNLMIGMVTPPFGMCLFTISEVSKLNLESLSKATIPFVIPLVIVLLMITYIPGLVTFLPNLLMS